MTDTAACRRRTPQSVAREWAHDSSCVGVHGGYCEPGGDGDHARRTTATFARDAVRAWRANVSLARLVHDRMCPCLNRDATVSEGHIHLFEPAADELSRRLADA